MVKSSSVMLLVFSTVLEWGRGAMSWRDHAVANDSLVWYPSEAEQNIMLIAIANVGSKCFLTLKMIAKRYVDIEFAGWLSHYTMLYGIHS